MSTAKIDAKKIRRVVQSQANAVTEQVAINIILRLYSLPLWERVKWAAKITRGLPMKESLWLWIISVFNRMGIEITYRTKRALHFINKYLFWNLAAGKQDVPKKTEMIEVECEGCKGISDFTAGGCALCKGTRKVLINAETK